MRACVRVASMRDDFFLDQLLALTMDSNIDVCETACSALSEFPSPHVIHILCNMLVQTNTRKQEAALLALNSIGEAVVPIAIARISTSSVEERVSLLRILGELRASEAIPHLIAGTIDLNPRIRMVSCRALGKIKSNTSYEHIRQCLADRQSSVRIAACEGLEELGDLRAVEDMLAMLTDMDRRVSNAAFYALDNLGGGALFRLSSAAAMGEADAIEEISRIEKDAISKICEPQLRQLLITNLGNVKKINLSSLILPILYDIDAGCRRAACETLGKYGDHDSVLELISLLRDKEPDVILAAMHALKLIGDFHDIDRIVAEVSVAKSELQENLCQSLQRLCMRVSGNYNAIYCLRCFHRFTLAQKNFNEILKYPVCRKCGKSEHGLTGITRVIAMLDSQMKRKFLLTGNTIRINYLASPHYFDFDAIEIVSADNYDIERLCVRLVNDGDPFRLSRFPYVTCHVYSDAKLTDSMFAMLRNIFPTLTERFALAREIDLWRQSE